MFRLGYCPCWSANILRFDLCASVRSRRGLMHMGQLQFPSFATNAPDWVVCAFMDNQLTTWLSNRLSRVICCLLPPGYSVAVLSTQSSIYFVAGAPRSNYTGRVVVYDVDSQGNISIVQSQRGEQASIFCLWLQILKVSILIDRGVDCSTWKIPFSSALSILLAFFSTTRLREANWSIFYDVILLVVQDNTQSHIMYNFVSASNWERFGELHSAWEAVK